MPATAQSTERFHARRRRRIARDRSEWDRKVAQPVNIGSIAASATTGTFALAANCRLIVQPVGFSIAVGDFRINYRSRSIRNPATIADGAFYTMRAYLERGGTITFTRGAGAGAGTLRIYVQDVPGTKRFQIATITFT